jgi:hypothetical protein
LGIYIKKDKSSIYHYCSNVWNSEDSNSFSVKLLDILVFFNFYKCVDLGKIFKNESIYFIWTKYGKNNIGQSWVFLYGTKDDAG